MMHDSLTNAADERLQDLATTAYIARAVFSDRLRALHGNRYRNEQLKTRAYLLAQNPDAIDDPHMLALVAYALLTLDSPDVAARCLDRLDSMKQTGSEGKQAWWEQAAGRHTTFYGRGASGSVETTALAALAFLRAGSHPGTSRAALTWLVAQRGAMGTWPSTQATVLSLQALVAGTDANLDDRERRIELVAGDSFRREIVIPADQAEVLQQVDLTPHLGHGVTRVRLTESSGTAAAYQVAFRYHVPGQTSAKDKGPLAINVRYDRTTVAVGDTVYATATATNQSTGSSAMVMLDLPVPAGFELLTDDLAALVQSETVAKFQMQPRGVLVYLRNLASDKPLTLKYRLKATTPAKVTAPAARVYEYYDPDRKGQSDEVRFTVS
jgi:uncharacterized protein YfaS (alpha-2-macroglobulin family)